MPRNSFYSGSVDNAVEIDTSASEAAASATAAAASAATASAKATTSTADAVATAADKVATNADVVLTAADVVSAEADRVAAAASASTASTHATTATTQAATATTQAATATTQAATATTQAGISTAKAVLTAADAVATAADKVATNADVVLTAADVVLAEADKVQTGLDRVATAADVVLTAADVVSAEADRVAAAASASTATTQASTATTQATAAAGSASTASTQAGIATAKAVLTAADAVATAADVVSSAANAASAAATYDNFDDRYLGSKSSAPSVDNDGNALAVGALYFDSTLDVMRVYTASGWIATSSATLATMERFVFTATANQTVFTGSDAGGDTLAIVVGAELVTLNGVVLEVTADYTVTTSAVTLTSGAAVNDELNVYAFGNFEVANHYTKTAADTLYDAKASLSGAAFTGAITTNSTFDGVDIATRDAVLTSTTTTANAALPKAGGAMTGAITTNSTFDGRDVATDGTKLDGIEASATADQTAEEIQDIVGAMVASNTETGITVTYEDGDGTLDFVVASQTDENFTTADHSKLDGIEASADVTDATNVTAAGALMDSEVTNLAAVKAFAASDYATAAQGTTADAALPKAGGAMTGAITTNSTFDGVDIATRDAVLTSTTTTANAALPKAGGAMTGAITTNSTFDGVDIATRDAVLTSTTTTANAALPKAGGTMTGAVVGATDTDTSNAGTVDLDFTDNTNFVLTLTGAITSLTASNEVAGQSGFIVFIQDGTGGRTVALHGDYETAGAAGLTLTSTASATDIVPYVVAASSRILLGTPQLAFA